MTPHKELKMFRHHLEKNNNQKPQVGKVRMKKHFSIDHKKNENELFLILFSFIVDS